ncbi:MAG: hypothetical protein HC770_05010 [Pseudanabaena sp. CRU_2_10]|nr:hypothetical protein [Pseudanabaena sp. CRU_2_10]
MIASLFAFSMSVLAIVSLLFILSYLVWADRSHTPEVVAAEASLFFQKVETAFPVFVSHCDRGCIDFDANAVAID